MMTFIFSINGMAQSDSDLTTTYSEAEYDDDAVYRDSIYGISGTIRIPEVHATINVPEGYVFINKEMAEYLAEYWGYDDDNNIFGALVPGDAQIFYNVNFALFLYNLESGYIDDTNAAYFDAEKYKKNVVASDNDSFITTKWIIEPHYNINRRILELCRQVEVHSEVSDNNDYTISEAFIYYIYLYNRLGYICMGTYADIDQLDNAMDLRKSIINSITFEEGYRYDDFDETSDKRGDYTIGTSQDFDDVNEVYINNPETDDSIESDDDSMFGQVTKYVIIAIVTILLTLLILRLAEMMSYRDNDRRRE